MKKLIIVACCMAIALVTNCANAQDVQQACQPPPATDNVEAEGKTAQSCDPNEIAGPLGTGEKRYVQPGDLLDYTIYFENKTNATAAAQEIFVDLPMDENLDWTTLELGEVVFGDHIDTSFANKKLVKKASLKASYAMPGTNTLVKTEVTAKNGVLSWYIRDWDPTTKDNFPKSATGGFLPPNDPETHCGEGHVSFSVKVRDDAPPGTVIRASAQIVFDKNPMIETDPSWWNTIAEPARIVFNANGGSGAMAPVETDMKGNAVLPACKFSRSGYVFAGWANTATGAVDYANGASVKNLAAGGSVTLYAQWTVDKYAVKYNKNVLCATALALAIVLVAAAIGWKRRR